MTEPLTTFPLQIVVYCDVCGIEVGHDYLVHDLMTRDQRLAVAREHMTRNEGWSCTAEGDFCPIHKPEASCPACDSEVRAEHGLVPGFTGMPVTCGDEWHDEED